MRGSELGSVQQILEHALRVRKLAAPLEQQPVAQARLRAGISRCQRCVGAFSVDERVLCLESAGIQELRIRRLEIRIMLRQSFERQARRGVVLLAEMRPRQPQQQCRIVLENAPQPALIDLDGGIVLVALEQLLPEPARRAVLPPNASGRTSTTT